MDANIIITNACTLGSNNSGRHEIRMSHNLLDNTRHFNKAALNLLIIIVFMFRKNITTHTIIGFEYSETKITIPARLIHNRHADISNSLEYLTESRLVFSRSIPGYPSGTWTRLISGIKPENGNLIVTIPSDAIPWILYCGTNVGFGLVETDVFLNLPSRTDKLMYLLMISKIDNSSSISSFTLSVDDLLCALNLKKDRPISSVLNKNLNPFLGLLSKSKSKYQLTFSANIAAGYSGRKGRKAIESISFMVRSSSNHVNENIQYEVAAELLISLMNAHGVKNIGLVRLIEAIDACGKEEEFVCKMQKLSLKNMDGSKKMKPMHIINSAAKILREDFGIEVKG